MPYEAELTLVEDGEERQYGMRCDDHDLVPDIIQSTLYRLRYETPKGHRFKSLTVKEIT